MFKDKCIIVTGGLGFIGKNFCRYVSGEFDNKLIIDKITYASDLDFFYTELKPKGWELIVGDVVNIEELVVGLPNLNRHLIINFAAESHVDNSFSNASKFLYSNGMGTLALLDFCRTHKNKFLHISTDEVYGENSGIGLTEDAALNPTNPYAATKAAADILVRTYIKSFKVDAKIVRANNIYGNRQLVEKVIPKAIYSAKNKKQFLLHGSKDLKRHFLHTDDFSEALLTVLGHWLEKRDVVYNVGANESVEIRKLVKYVYSTLNADPKLIQIGADRPFNDIEYEVNDDLIRGIGWSPKKDFWLEIHRICQSGSIFLGGQHFNLV